MTREDLHREACRIVVGVASEAKHSPLPWRMSKIKEPSDTTDGARPYVEDSAGIIVAKMYRSAMRDNAIVEIPGKANAAFVVRACNSYHEMVDALRRIERALLSDPSDGGPQKHVGRDDVIYRLDGQLMYVALNAARAALAKAEAA